MVAGPGRYLQPQVFLTARLLNIPRPSGIRHSPARARVLGPRLASAPPPTLTVPRDSLISPAAARSRVAFPAPLGPSRATTLPSGTVKSFWNREADVPKHHRLLVASGNAGELERRAGD
jgi:hypothetical protein